MTEARSAAASGTQKYAIVGTFDVSNFGDLLFPLAAEKALSERLGDVEVVAYSYRSMAADDWFYEVRPVQRLGPELHGYDGLIVGGGLIIRGDRGITPGYVPTDSRQHHPLSLWLLPSLAALSLGVPVAFNAPGVLAGIPSELSPLVEAVLTGADYVSVRDATSARRLQELAPAAGINVVPDSIFDVPELLPEQPSEAFLTLQGRLGLEEPYVLFQPSSHAELVPQHLAPVLDAARAHGCRVIELPIGPVNGDRVGRVPIKTDAAVSPWPHPLVIAEVISHARAVVGDSLHLSVVAAACGVPVYRPRREAGKHSEALDGLQRVYEWNPEIEPRAAEHWTDFTRRTPGQDVSERRSQVRAHWDSVVRAFSEPDPSARRALDLRTSLPTTFGMTLQRFQSTVDGLHQRQDETVAAAEHQALQAQRQCEELEARHARELVETQAARDEERRRTEAAERLREEQERNIVALRAQHVAALNDRAAAFEETAGRLREVLERQNMAEQALEELRRSKGMRLVRIYQRGLDRLVPPGSRRREGYLRAIHRAAPQVAPLTATPTDVPAPDRLTTSEQPVVSVIIPVHDQWAFTARCLASLARDVPRHPYEVVIVDDASSDKTREHVQRVSGLRTVLLDENVGFVRACNAGMRVARGSFMVLLNNDTEVRPGWLDALVDTAEADDTVGVVGAKLVYGDGSLQEAGGIIWSDGDGWNYGRGDDPDDPAYCFVREVDYCSGAALLVRTSLLQELGGGLDERYAPAYYEDTDLCFAARERGYRVVYQPASVVVHHEGISHGTDVVGTGVKRYQAINREKFLERWAGALAAQHPHDAALVPLSRSRSPRGRVLVVDHHVPTYDRDAGSVRMWALLRLLREEGYDVTFVPDNKARLEPYSTAMQQAGIEVLYGHLDMEERLAALACGTVLALLSRAHVADSHLDLVRRTMPGVPVVYDTVDLHHLREQRRADLTGDGDRARTAQRSRQQELGLVARTEATLVVSDYERDALLAELPGATVRVVSIVHEVRGDVPGPHGRSGMLFVGSFRHDPNVDAVVWFTREVLPLVREKRPDAVLTVAGGDLVPEIEALQSEAVQVLGWVPELAPHYDLARVVVVPLRYGAGVKGKIGEALAEGVPVVSTAVGAEGMGLMAEQDLLVADTPCGLANAVLRLLEDDDLWKRTAEAGRQAVERRYGVTAARAALAEVLSAVAS